MLERLKDCIGYSIVVDYKTNTGKLVYGKGILKEILDPDMLVIEGDDGTIWCVSFSSITSMKVSDKGDDNNGLKE